MRKNKKYTMVLFFLFFCAHAVLAQDSTVTIDKKVVTLKEVIVRSNFDVASFIRRIQTDTTFYKAFRNLKVLGFISLNDVRMLDKNGELEAMLDSKTEQVVKNGCRSMNILQQTTHGDIYNRDSSWNYYTLELYAGLMFTQGTVCGETNIVKDIDRNLSDKKGIEKHKEQLKMLFFNPGRRIPGVPFIGNKVALFDDDVAKLYDFTIDMEPYLGKNSYVFKIKARSDLSRSERNDIVINEMTTWFDCNTMEIVGRKYDLSYDAGIYDFDVHMEVQLTKFGEYLVPKLIRYNGNWHVAFKKRERGVFTATLFDYKQ
jgi:hypothetical protein